MSHSQKRHSVLTDHSVKAPFQRGGRCPGKAAPRGSLETVRERGALLWRADAPLPLTGHLLVTCHLQEELGAVFSVTRPSLL